MRLMHSNTNFPGAGLPVHTAFALSAQDLLHVQLRAGDSVQGEAGNAWITIDGQLQDIVLGAGERYTAQASGPVMVSALRCARLAVIGHAPLRWRRAGPGPKVQ